MLLLALLSTNRIWERNCILCCLRLVCQVPLLLFVRPNRLCTFRHGRVLKAKRLCPIGEEVGLEVDEGCVFVCNGRGSKRCPGTVKNANHAFLLIPLTGLLLFRLQFVLILVWLFFFDSSQEIALVLTTDIEDVPQGDLSSSKVVGGCHVVIPDFNFEGALADKLVPQDCLLIFPLSLRPHPHFSKDLSHGEVKALVENGPERLHDDRR
mmetsp:Transcript_100264/g.180934  ORF Transcript_100264/g.180934 Transcript_100264/m.180934 type:complete len:209 (+) Transcript_100264:200-826(+)